MTGLWTILFIIGVFILYLWFKRPEIKQLSTIQNELITNDNKNHKILEEKIEEIKKEISPNISDLIDRFYKYIRDCKVAKLDHLAKELNTSHDQVVKDLREIENKGNTVGFLDGNGNYFNLNDRELEVLFV